MIEYRTNVKSVSPDDLRGFFVGWRSPLTAEQHWQILQNSAHCVLAYDTKTCKVVGFINALSDDVSFAFIPMLEVLPQYQGRGIGKRLVESMLELLSSIKNIDLMCDQDMQAYYQQFGMLKSHGMVLRKYLQLPGGGVQNE